jgi:hypothetical protein
MLNGLLHVFLQFSFIIHYLFDYYYYYYLFQFYLCMIIVFLPKKTNLFLNRQKRAIADWLLAPDTKWCGKGNSAKGVYSKLGGASRADMCCRKHDHCKMTIAGLTSKFHYFNVRPFTISHCACDLR